MAPCHSGFSGGHRLPTPCSGKSGIQIFDLLSSCWRSLLRFQSQLSRGQPPKDFTVTRATERKPRCIDIKLVPGNACFSGCFSGGLMT